MTDQNKPRPVPSKKPGAKKSGPSMKEQLLARRLAEEEAAAKRTSKATPTTSGRAASKSGARPAAKAAPAGGGATRSAGGGRRAAAGGRSRRGVPAVDSNDASEVRRRLRENRKRSPLPFILVGVLVVGAGAAYVLMPEEDAPGDAGVAAAGPDEGAALESGAATAPVEGAGGEGAAPAAAGGGVEDTASGVGAAAGATAPTDGGAKPSGDGAPDENEIKSSVKLAVTRDKNDPNNPNLIDITKLSSFDRPPGMSAEDWASHSEDAATFLDPDAGAASGRARRRLLEAGIDAWPAIVNEMLKLDVRLPKDNQSGMIAQRTLDEIRGGTTGYAFDWRTPEVSGEPLEPKKQWVNKFTVVKLHDVWRKHLEDPAYFREKIAKGEVKKAMESTAPPAEFDDLGGDLDDLDDLGG